MAKAVLGKIQSLLVILAGVIIIVAVAMLVLHIKPAVVLSGSMEPEIKTGSLIFIDQKDTDVSEGDIIAFDSGGTFVAHRAIEKKGDGWITKGDNNECQDHHPVKQEDIKGTVKLWIPAAGAVIRNIKAVMGFL